jgi:hypothetical protein
MRDAGLRFSTLSTGRSRVSYKLYQRHGYVDMNIWATALAKWETAHQPTRLRAECIGQEGFDYVEKTFQNLASDYLGYAWRHTPFARLRDRVHLDDIWVVSENNDAVGYVFARKDDFILHIDIQLLRLDIDAVEVAAAVASKIKTSYVQVTISRPSDILSFQRADWQVAHPTWDAFMVKPLTDNVTVNNACRLFGIGTDRFLISWLDTT